MRDTIKCTNIYIMESKEKKTRENRKLMTEKVSIWLKKLF